MPKILVNYKFSKKTNEYVLIDNNGYVFADQPIAVMPKDVEFDEVLIVPIDGTPTVVEKSEYLSKNKLFKILVDEEGNVFEDNNGVEIYLPIGTNLEEIKYIDNKLVRVEKSSNETGGE